MWLKLIRDSKKVATRVRDHAGHFEWHQQIIIDGIINLKENISNDIASTVSVGELVPFNFNGEIGHKS